jgi:hypothetical protein
MKVSYPKPKAIGNRKPNKDEALGDTQAVERSKGLKPFNRYDQFHSVRASRV